MKFYIESKGIYGNFIWDKDISIDLKLDIISLFNMYFKFVSCFPEGDGLCCSINEIPINLSYSKRKDIFFILDNFFVDRDIDWYTNILNEKEIELHQQLLTQYN